MTIQDSKKLYLDDASRAIGNMLHNAVYEYDLNGVDFLDRFIQSGIASEIENGNPTYLAGKSGHELFLDVMEKTSGTSSPIKNIVTYTYSDAYWVGWILTHYQFYSGRSFRRILTVIPYDELISLYGTLHEADPEKSYEIFDAHFESQECPLKTIRLSRSLTQEKLSKLSGVSASTIRAYEQKQKDIGKAQVNVLMRLANALNCDAMNLVQV